MDFNKEINEYIKYSKKKMKIFQLMNGLKKRSNIS